MGWNVLKPVDITDTFCECDNNMGSKIPNICECFKYTAKIQKIWGGQDMTEYEAGQWPKAKHNAKRPPGT